MGGKKIENLHSYMDKDQIITASKYWVEQFVIDLKLCPFAHQPFSEKRIRFEICASTETEEQLLAFWQEVVLLTRIPKEQLSTSLLILPSGLDDFEDYLDFYDLCEQLLEEQNHQELFQLASFHPGYQFDNTKLDDHANYTNRSPYPMIHLLRVEEVAAAIAHYPNVQQVPMKNMLRLRSMTKAAIETKRTVPSK